MTPIVIERFKKYRDDLWIKNSIEQRRLLIAGYIDCLKDFGYVTDDEMLILYRGEC